MDKKQILQQLVAMSRNLGAPEKDYVTLGEGNTSAKIDDQTFYVKVSGACLDGITANEFVEVYKAQILDILKNEVLTDEEIKTKLMAAKVDQSTQLRPSVETVFHGLLLDLEGVNFIGHTHPTPVNAILCSKRGPEAIKGRLFPDEIVYCGIAPAYIEYTDPGVQLARAIGDAIDKHTEKYSALPKVILIGNHGLIALGSTAREVENITAMWVKTAKILLGTYALGGPRYLTPENVSRIYTRPDEEYRGRRIKGS